MENLDFKLVKGEPLILKIFGALGIIGLVLLCFGAIFYISEITIGTKLMSIGFFLGIIPSIGFSLIKSGGRFFKQKLPSDELISFRKEAIKISEKLILLDEIRTLEAKAIEFKGQPRFVKYNPICDGTGNYFSLKLKDSSEISFQFFIESQFQFELLNAYLHSLKTKKSILVIK